MIRSLTIERFLPLRRWLPADVYFWLKAFILALIAIQLARLFWAIASPVGPFGDWRPVAPQLLSPEAQEAVLASVDPFFRPGAMEVSASAEAPALDLQLFGVRQSMGRIPGSAILGAADGEQTNYLVGEEVAPGVTLAAVNFDHIVLERGGARQTIYMEGAEQAQGQGGATAPAAVSSSAATLVAGAFEFKPRNQSGRVTGVTVAPGQNQALFQSAGFRAGDVIVAVNGARITSMIDVQQLQSNIAPGARLLLTVERGAETVPIALNLPGNS